FGAPSRAYNRGPRSELRRESTMSSSSRNGSMAGPIAIAAILTLAVTLLRLYGELQGWSPVFFNRDAGGPLSIVGIAWLVPLFGIWFSMRLCDQGRGPKSKALALTVSIVALIILGAGMAFVGGPDNPRPAFQRIAVLNVAAVVAGTLAF